MAKKNPSVKNLDGGVLFIAVYVAAESPRILRGTLPERQLAKSLSWRQADSATTDQVTG